MNLEKFDIAHYTGHKAMERLSRCYRLFTLPIDFVIQENGIDIQSFDFKEKSDYKEQLRNTNILQFNIDSIDYINAFHFATYIRELSRKEVEFCIDASIFFQVMMEADINDVIDNRKVSFKNKWINYMNSHDANEGEIQNFMHYFNEIYKGIRNPIIHAEHRMGWFSFVFLLNKEYNLNLDYEQNWEQMCEIHNMPSSIGNINFPNLEELAQLLHKKHLNELNKLNTSENNNI